MQGENPETKTSCYGVNHKRIKGFARSFNEKQRQFGGSEIF